MKLQKQLVAERVERYRAGDDIARLALALYYLEKMFYSKDKLEISDARVTLRGYVDLENLEKQAILDAVRETH